MSGFPNRLNRAALGPTREDVWPVTDPKKAVDAKTFNLEHWQLAGLNLTAARMLLGVTLNAGTPSTTFQGLAWDPNQALPLINWAKVGTGIYDWSLPQAEYPDEQNNQVTVNLLGAMVFPQAMNGAFPVIGHNERTGPRSGRVRIYSNGMLYDMADNETFILWAI